MNTLNKRMKGITMTIQVTDGGSDQRDGVTVSTQSCRRRDRIGEAGPTGTLSPGLKIHHVCLKTMFSVRYDEADPRIHQL